MKKLVFPLLIVSLLAGCLASPAPQNPEHLAEALSQDYGITILLGEKALEAVPWDYRFIPEEAEESQLLLLNALEAGLQQYPKSMIRALSKDQGGLTISLLKEIKGTQDGGGFSSVKGLQFYDEDHRCRIALSKDLPATLYHELFHALEDFITPRTELLDHWESLNPSDFSYSENFHSVPDSPYLKGPNRAFIDSYSMSFPREDRARVMEYAMLPGKETLFASPILKKKLSCLSEAIREAFSLQDTQILLPWEQYLDK